MPKRDYKSYNVLGEELAQEGNYEEHEYVEAYDIDAVSPNKSMSQTEDNLQAHVIEASPARIGKLSIEEDKKDSMGEAALQPQKKINLGKKLRKNKETDLNKSVEVANNIGLDKNLHVDSNLHADNNMRADSNLYVDSKPHVNSNLHENSNIHVDENIDTDKNIDVDNYEDKSKYVNEKADKKIDKNKEVDMTFSAYKTQYQTKKRSKLVKWSMRLAKLILVIMLLPLIAIVSCVVLGFFGGFLTAIITAIGMGVLILGAICFMSTQVSASLIALGIAVSVTCISLGSILFILFWMLLKWIGGLFKKYKKPSSQSIRKEKK